MPGYLKAKYSEEPFDFVLDAYGVQDLYDHCADFLKPDGHFVTVGIAFAEYSYGSMAVAVKNMLWNVLCSAWGGSATRPYVQVASTCNLEGLERLRAMCEDRAMRVPLDSEWGFTQVLEVSSQIQESDVPGGC